MPHQHLIHIFLLLVCPKLCNIQDIVTHMALIPFDPTTHIHPTPSIQESFTQLQLIKYKQLSMIGSHNISQRHKSQLVTSSSWSGLAQLSPSLLLSNSSPRPFPDNDNNKKIPHLIFQRREGTRGLKFGTQTLGNPSKEKPEIYGYPHLARIGNVWFFPRLFSRGGGHN